VSDAWSAPAGSASGSLGLARGQGKDRLPVCFQLAAELPGRPLAHLPGIYVKVTVAWPTVRAGGRPSYAANSAAGWNTDHMPGLREPGIAGVCRWCCQQRVPGGP
jgi:hypothetical protein